MLKIFVFIFCLVFYSTLHSVFGMFDGDKFLKKTEKKEEHNLKLLNYAEKGYFIYTNALGELVEVEISGNKHIEYYNNKQYKIVSTIEWTNHREFQLSVIENTLPESTECIQVEIGDAMKIELKKFKRNKIRFKAIYKQEVWGNSLYFIPTK